MEEQNRRAGCVAQEQAFPKRCRRTSRGSCAQVRRDHAPSARVPRAIHVPRGPRRFDLGRHASPGRECQLRGPECDRGRVDPCICLRQ